jgi:hypothetical protein
LGVRHLAGVLESRPEGVERVVSLGGVGDAHDRR